MRAKTAFESENKKTKLNSFGALFALLVQLDSLEVVRLVEGRAILVVPEAAARRGIARPIRSFAVRLQGASDSASFVPVGGHDGMLPNQACRTERADWSVHATGA